MLCFSFFLLFDLVLGESLLLEDDDLDDECDEEEEEVDVVLEDDVDETDDDLLLLRFLFLFSFPRTFRSSVEAAPSTLPFSSFWLSIPGLPRRQRGPGGGLAVTRKG